jgi:toxin FitB
VKAPEVPALLDTNVVSELLKPDPSLAVLDWVGRSEWYLPAPVVAEMQEGVESVPSAARKAQLLARLDAFLSGYGEMLLSWDAETARTWGRLKHSPEVRRQPQALWDSLIDAMAIRYGFVVATRNGGDFRHAETFNPWMFSEHPPAQ